MEFLVLWLGGSGVGTSSHTQKGYGFNFGQATYRGCEFDPAWGTY